MKPLYEFLTENHVDKLISTALGSMGTMEDVESLGETFGVKYSEIIGKALVEFLDGVAQTAGRNDARVYDAIENLRKQAEKI